MLESYARRRMRGMEGGECCGCADTYRMDAGKVGAVVGRGVDHLSKSFSVASVDGDGSKAGNAVASAAV
jgi:hypothetical protein